jgi:hypothetical protein
MLVCIKDGKVIDVKLKTFKPPRFFEAFLRGRKFTEAPDIHRAHLRYLPGRLPNERVSYSAAAARL